MPDREKVIKGLETCKSSDKTCSDCPYNGEVCTTSLCGDVLALLKEQDVDQIPEKVNRDRTCEVYPGEWVRKGSCPHCDKVVHWFTNRKYCGFCGKAVKWE